MPKVVHPGTGGQASTFQQRFPRAVVEVMDANGRPCLRAKDPLGCLLLGRVCPVLSQRRYGELRKPYCAATAGGLRRAHLPVKDRALDL
jgi:hypothetical protein